MSTFKKFWKKKFATGMQGNVLIILLFVTSFQMLNKLLAYLKSTLLVRIKFKIGPNESGSRSMNICNETRVQCLIPFSFTIVEYLQLQFHLLGKEYDHSLGC